MIFGGVIQNYNIKKNGFQLKFLKINKLYSNNLVKRNASK